MIVLCTLVITVISKVNKSCIFLCGNFSLKSILEWRGIDLHACHQTEMLFIEPVYVFYSPLDQFLNDFDALVVHVFNSTKLLGLHSFLESAVVTQWHLSYPI